VIPRGAGTGLAGGAIGDGLVVDLARHSRHIGDLDRERQTVRVGAGVVLDQLNAFLRPMGCGSGRMWPPPAGRPWAHDRQQLVRAHAPVYGTTVDHVERWRWCWRTERSRWSAGP